MSGFLGKGPSFPLVSRPREDASDTVFGWASDADKVRQSIELILSTAPGERLMRPDFGCGIHELVFEPSTPALRSLLIDRVRTALVRFEPRIDVVEVDAADATDHPERILIDIAYRLRTNNSLHNLVYPFYLQEGTA